MTGQRSNQLNYVPNRGINNLAWNPANRAFEWESVASNAAHFEMIYMTSMAIAPAGAQIVPCETDLMVLSENGFYEDGVGLAIGECKARDEITEGDVRNLTQAADAFPKDRIHPYIVFAKTAPFTAEEIARWRAA